MINMDTDTVSLNRETEDPSKLEEDENKAKPQLHSRAPR